jgi:hypothetical protein
MEDRKRMNATRHQGDALEDVGAALGEEHAAEGRAAAQHGGAQEDADEHVGDGAELAKAVEHEVGGRGEVQDDGPELRKRKGMGFPQVFTWEEGRSNGGFTSLAQTVTEW